VTLSVTGSDPLHYWASLSGRLAADADEREKDDGGVETHFVAGS